MKVTRQDSPFGFHCKFLYSCRWKENIAEAVLECATIGMVPDYAVPVDPAIQASLPKLPLSKVNYRLDEL